jgi:hypothetical protein
MRLLRKFTRHRFVRFYNFIFVRIFPIRKCSTILIKQRLCDNSGVLIKIIFKIHWHIVLFKKFNAFSLSPNLLI